ncbi:MAG TPA: TetR/AcrR family transcriptional regulator [Anaerolineales bacterium]|nr:TetR/AcrR family transcriptional regulator [Anaerolineales bacterium]
MPRVVKEDDYAARCNEILKVASQLVYTKGYEQMSIQDILDALKISKGAFYHYFDSKQALLDGLVDQMLDEADQFLRPIVEAKDLSALEKMRSYFNTAARWKTDNKALMLNLIRVWYTDANALVRQKQQAAAMKRIAPMLTEIIRQGIAEGAFTMKYPDEFGGMLLGLSRGVQDTLVELVLAEESAPDALQRLESIMGAYSESMERILGAPPGSLPIGDAEMLKAWLPPPSSTPKP